MFFKNYQANSEAGGLMKDLQEKLGNNETLKTNHYSAGIWHPRIVLARPVIGAANVVLKDVNTNTDLWKAAFFMGVNGTDPNVIDNQAVAMKTDVPFEGWGWGWEIAVQFSSKLFVNSENFKRFKL